MMEAAWATMTRREFVGLGITAALGTLAGNGYRGETIRLGLLGTGRRGLSWLPPFARLDAVTWGGLADPDSCRVRAALKQCGQIGLAPAVRSDEALLFDPGIDAVVIAAPAERSIELACRACAAGKDVLVDGPLALDENSMRRLLALAVAGDQVVRYGMPALVDPEARHALRRVTAQGPSHVRVEYVSTTGEPASGVPLALLNEISLALAGLGGEEPHFIRTARGRTLDRGMAVDRLGVWCDFESGARLEISISCAERPLRAAGDAAGVRLSGAGKSVTVARSGTPDSPRYPRASPALAIAFMTSVRQRSTGLDPSLSHAALAHAILWNTNSSLVG